MANILSLALKVTADGSGLKLDPIQRALASLGAEADKLTGAFDKFTSGSSAAGEAQQKFAAQLEDLTRRRADDLIGATQYAVEFEKITVAIREQAAAFEEGARVTARYTTEEEKRSAEIERLDRLLQQRAITEETYSRAVADASGANAEAARQQAEQDRIAADAQKARQALESRAAAIIGANATAQERYDQQLAELNNLQREGLLTTEQYNRALAAAKKPLDDAAASAEKNTLKFNELSGVFAVLPGPLGNIAGRISGLSSAGEGLSRIFAGGLQSGIKGLVGSFTALVNPVTLALAGVTAFAAAATGIAQGLVALEDRVEKLGRLADQLGVSFGFVQVLEEAGKRTNVSVEQLSGSFARLQKSLAGADEESKKAQAALSGVGISVEELSALSQDDQIRLLGERLAGIEDPAERSAAAMALFGRSGVQLLPFFKELGLAGSDMERFGRAVEEIDKQRLADLGGGLDALGLATQGLGTSLLLPFTGLAEGVSFAFAEIVAGITAIVDPIGQILEPIFTQVGRIVEVLGIAIGAIGRQIGTVLEPFAVAIQGISQALEPLYDGFVDLFRSFSDGNLAVTEWLVSFTPIGLIAENIGKFGEVISRVFTIITTAATRIAAFFGEIAGRFAETVEQSSVLSTVANVVSAVFETISSFVGGIVEGIGDFVNNLLTLAENFLGIDRNAAAAAASTAALGDEIVALSADEQKLLDEQDKFLAGYASKVSDAINQSAQFGQAGFDAALQYQTAIGELQEQFDKGILNEESFAREAEKATAAYNAQIDTIKEAAAETEAIVTRVDGLLEKANEIPKIEADLLAVEAEIARVEAAAVEARANGQTEQADALAARLGQLDQLQASLADQADQAALGFKNGFEDAFAAVDDGLASIVAGAAEFGDEGFAAAQRLADGIAAAQAQVEDGILNAAAFEAEVARQEELYNLRIEQLEKEKKAREDAEKKIADERLKINEFVDNQIALAAVGGDSARLEAAKNVAAIEQEIARLNADIEAARASNDQAAIDAATARIGQLDQIAAKENDIASGRAAAEEELAKARDESLKEQQKQVEAYAKAQEQQASQAQAAQQKQNEEFQKFFEASAAENERVLEKNRQLATASTEAAQGADIRTTEGANAFIAAVQGGFDPQLALQRQQLKVLQRIDGGLALNLARLGFQTVAFPGRAGG